jgi:nucleoside-diphosphate-sugar epimerase
MVAEIGSMSHVAQTILVTGAGGFLGGTLVEALYFAGNYRVRAGIARWANAPRIARLPITLVQCDVMKAEELATACAGVDFVIHCAVGGDLRIISEGTGQVLRAAAQAGVKRLIHLSSIAVYGGATGAVDEATKAPPGTLSAYGAAKIAAEVLCKTVALEVVVLRPSIIYGPFSAQWTLLPALRLKAGRWQNLGELGEGTCNPVYVHDVARFAIAALQQKGVAGEVFNVNGPEVVTWNEYYERLNRHLGLPPLTSHSVRQTRIKTARMGPIRALGKHVLKHHASRLLWLSHKSDCLKRWMQQTELALKCTPNQDELTLFSLDAHYLKDKAAQMMGLTPSIDLDTGLATSLAWLKHMCGE